MDIIFKEKEKLLPNAEVNGLTLSVASQIGNARTKLIFFLNN